MALSGNILADALDIGKTIGDQTQGYIDKYTRRKAGSVLAGGDYQGASNVLNQAGMLGEGQKLQEYGQGNAEFGQKQQDRSNTVAGATAYANRDYSGAAQALAKTGDVTGVGAVNAAQTADSARQLEVVHRGSQALRQAVQQHGPQAAGPAWDSISPVLKTLNVDPAHMDQMRQAFVANPLGFLDGIDASVAKEKGVVLGPGSNLVDPETGSVRASTPFKPEYHTVGEGQSLVETGGGPAPAAASAPAPTGQLRSTRNNNPGNIEDGPFAQALPGYAGGDGRFAKFSDPGSGQQAQVALLGSYGKRGIDTVSGIINRWAPASDGNDTAGYANFVANKIGVKPGQKLDMTDPGTLSDIAVAIKQFEGGGQSKSSPAPAALAPEGAQTAPGARVVAMGQPKTPDDGGTPLAPDAIDMAATRYAMSGTLPPLGVGKAAREDKAKIQNRASELIKEWGVKPEDWVTGMAQIKVAQGSLKKISDQRAMLGAFERTANDNADLALSLSTKGAGPAGVPIIDKYLRAGMKATGDKDVAAFDAALGGFADEYAKIVSGSMGNTAPSDAVRRSAHDRINASMSKGQLAGVIGTMRTEMANRMKELDTERDNQVQGLHALGAKPVGDAAAPGSTRQPGFSKALTPQQRATAAKSRGGAAGSVGNPYAPINEGEYNGLPKGSHYIFTDGSVRVKN